MSDKAGEHECEYCSKNFEWEYNESRRQRITDNKLFEVRSQNGIKVQVKNEGNVYQAWCPLCYRSNIIQV